MASPDVFLSPPSHASRRGVHMAISSSPELPSLQEILSKKPRNPPLRSGSRAVPIPDNAMTTFTSAGRIWRSLQANEPATTTSAARGAGQESPLEDIDMSTVVDVPPEKVPKPRKPRQRKKPATAVVELTSESPGRHSTPPKNQPWKKYKSPSKEKDKCVDAPPSPKTLNPMRERAPRDEAESLASHALKESDVRKPANARRVKSAATGPPESQKETKAKTRKDQTIEPLQLEPAMSRRMDWTPPKQTTRVILDSEASETRCSQIDDDPAQPFGSLIAAYKCRESAQQEPVPITDEDSYFLKKRKLVELQSKSAGVPEASRPERSPVKQKAPKKKPRTITGLATAAYRVPTEAEAPLDPATVAVDGNQENKASKPSLTAKGKPKARKRAPKAPKKPAAPPKPILLSPGAAMRQVARQDFVFGTSSQLARELSPTLLRDLQAAMRDSNQLDCVDLVTPVNSDAIEPPDRRPALWDAAARDADGDLFDLEVCNLADGSQGTAPPAAEDDPFGYVRADNAADALPDLPARDSPQDDDSFLNLSDILPAPGRKPAQAVDDEAHFSGSDTSTGTSTGRQGASGKGHPKELQRGQAAGKKGKEDSAFPPAPKEAPSQPSYDSYSDAQLAKQVAQYGFKPIKKRTAMIALLEQCRRSGAASSLGSVRSASTAAGASRDAPTASASLAAETAKEKRPRGRPRKTSAGDAQEPPPSAQPTESPKRPRGRPKKVASASPTRGSAAARAKATATSPQAPATPKRKAKPKAVIEIPDSESETAGDSSASPRSSPDPTFSPAQPVDLTLSLDEDTELSLAMPPTDQQSDLHVHITKAVTTAPRATDPANPSWHEKMLLYDPIVLEDLTSWLNCGQLSRVGYDGEASVGEVKKWCESKSVCCLWKVNLRGKERKRY